MNIEDFFVLDRDGRRGHSKKLKVQSCSLDIRKYSFSVRVVDLWNRLSDETVCSDTLATFKKRLDVDMNNLGFV